MRKTWLFIGLGGLLAFSRPGSPQTQVDPDAATIVRQIDALYRSDSSEALVEMEIVTPHWQRTLRMKAWSLGMDKTFIRILEPKKEEGIKTLRIGNEMWNYLPKINKVMKIPPSMMMSSWMGSDFTNDDLVKEFTFLESYHFELVTPDAPEEGLVYIKCVPREGLPIVWGHVLIAARRIDAMPVWEKYFDEKGTLVREMLFKEVKSFGSRRIPAVMELIPRTKKGQKTVLRYLEARFDVGLDPDIFTLRNLRGGI
ncbi:MAG TPA: outer membrane lipoprotein-sorting protein [Candidatus Desulfaltia sp.]|nr:outer membrane lipoprotein-sorting protein [Candidatus Desulfaltia sp.]